MLDNCATCTVSNSEIDHNGSTGIITQNGSNGVTISNNLIHDNGLSGTGDDNGIGLGNIGNGSSNITVTNNNIYNNAHSAIEIASTNTNQVLSNVTVEYNILSGSSAGDGAADGLKVGGGHTGQVYAYNLIYGNSDYGYSHTEGTSGDPQVLMYGNTIYGNGTSGEANVYVNGNSLTFKNNIVAQSAGLEATVLGSYTLTSDYNIWYHSAGGNFMSYQGTPGTFAGWETASGGDSHSVSSNPTFTTAGSNFTLQAGSPAIDAGVNLGSTYQNAISPAYSSYVNGFGTTNQNNSGAGWEMGAYVYCPACIGTFLSGGSLH